MARVRSKVFHNNKTQAVRLPKAVAMPADVREVEITAVGHARVITPVGHSWDLFFDGPAVSADFMSRREQPPMQRRKTF